MQASSQKTFLLAVAFHLVQFVVGFCPPPGIASPLNASVCYQILAVGSSFYSAADTCKQAGGGNLTSIHNAFTNSFLRAQAAKKLTGVTGSFLIGATDWHYNRTAGEGEVGNWTWADGTPLDYTNWARGEPVKDDNKNCLGVTVRDGLWHTQGCYGHRALVCELPAMEDPCDYGWKAFNGSCYRWFPQIGTFLYRPENATSWSKANQTCVEEWDAGLVSIHSDEENKFVWGLAPNASTVDEDKFWTGLHWNNTNEDEPWFWSDGTEVDYTSWFGIYGPTGDPDDLMACVEMWFGAGDDWDTYFCPAPLSFVCKKPAYDVA
ncbi:hypothetical protein AAVH_28092 [Aphelenchoides avenae]|nr:hypothetical protein AAVH_28092 [Aphelenchus avenae]